MRLYAIKCISCIKCIDFYPERGGENKKVVKVACRAGKKKKA